MTLSINSIDILDMCFANDVSTAEFEHWLTHIQQYFEHKKTFVLIMQTAPNTIFPDHYRDIQNTWYKHYKNDFYQHCLGLVRIAQNETDRIRLNTPALHKAWHVPYYVCLNKSDAIHWSIQRWL